MNREKKGGVLMNGARVRGQNRKPFQQRKSTTKHGPRPGVELPKRKHGPRHNKPLPKRSKNTKKRIPFPVTNADQVVVRGIIEEKIRSFNSKGGTPSSGSEDWDYVEDSEW